MSESETAVSTQTTQQTTQTTSSTQTSSIPDTGQTSCYDSKGSQISCPKSGQSTFGQDANYEGATPAFQNNGDGTITDLNTGLMWQQSPDTDGNGTINASDKRTYNEAISAANSLTLAGYDDWRLPTITELYSLIDFSGQDVSGFNGTDTSGLIPFIDTDYFEFGYGDSNAGERIIDAQFASSTKYVSTTMNGDETMFGVNFADGRIKGYGLSLRGSEKEFYVIFVRDNTEYDTNSYTDIGNGIINDNVTGLMWQQDDSGSGMEWSNALTYCESLSTGSYDDWRLPNAKELQSIVDHGRSPDTTNSAAIDPLFNATQITNEAGQADYAAYWTSTTHANMSQVPGANAAYITFGRAMGYMNGTWMDVHGAGAQRSDPKSGDPNDYPTGHGPQGDAIRIYNYVRCVRDGATTTTSGGVVTTSNNTNQTQPGSEQPNTNTPPTNSDQGQPPATNDNQSQPIAGEGGP
ncbi:MAG: DUF1566 domain-containing protein [Chloroflexi bacterium]|nr:MAG: DUF1566 domain-containing protein [Chloroflexota bacterium]